MKRKLIRLIKKLAVLAGVLVCVWCGGTKIQSWAKAGGGEALLYAAGIRGEKEAEGDISSGIGSQNPETEESIDGGGMQHDGIVPFIGDVLPGAAATPDPERTWATVEEIELGGGTMVDSFFVKDTTDSGTDLNAELMETPPVKLKMDESVEVLLYHTHTCEAYSEQYTGFYYTDMNTRTENREMSVVAVGEEIKKSLEAEGIGVVHDTTINDRMYNGSYSRSWDVLQKNLELYPTIQVTIDIHRDSMTTEDGLKYKPTAVVDGRKAAQIMFLAGCDASGDWGDFPNWRENLRFILRAQKTATELYPQLVRPLNFSNSKYNMNATSGSMLVEVGTEVNTVSEAKYSGRLIGEILAKTLKEVSK